MDDSFFLGVTAVVLLVPTGMMAVVMSAMIWYALYRRMLNLIVGVKMGCHPDRSLMGVFDV